MKEISGGEQLVVTMPKVLLPFQRYAEDCYQLLSLGAADKVFFNPYF